METLSQKQRRFTMMIAKLIEFAYSSGFELSFGDAYRDPRLHGNMGFKKGYGAPSSCHKLRLAVDFNLFINGKYQTDSEAFRPLADYWKSLAPDARAGIDWQDGNHFSLEHDGYK